MSSSISVTRAAIGDLSDENGYQFEFRCDICGSGYRSEFQRSALGSAGSLLGGVGNLLGGIGCKMIYESFRQTGAPKPDRHSLLDLATTAIGTSIDALAVGVTLAFLDAQILLGFVVGDGKQPHLAYQAWRQVLTISMCCVINFSTHSPNLMHGSALIHRRTPIRRSVHASRFTLLIRRQITGRYFRNTAIYAER